MHSMDSQIWLQAESTASGTVDGKILPLQTQLEGQGTFEPFHGGEPYGL